MQGPVTNHSEFSAKARTPRATSAMPPQGTRTGARCDTEPPFPSLTADQGWNATDPLMMLVQMNSPVSGTPSPSSDQPAEKTT